MSKVLILKFVVGEIIFKEYDVIEEVIILLGRMESDRFLI